MSEPAGDYYHWHVEIIPKLTKVAGFEWATGFYLNPTAPEEAAQVLRDARRDGLRCRASQRRTWQVRRPVAWPKSLWYAVHSVDERE